MSDPAHVWWFLAMWIADYKHDKGGGGVIHGSVKKRAARGPAQN